MTTKARVITLTKDPKRQCLKCGDLKPLSHFKNKAMVCKDCKAQGKARFIKAQERRAP